MDKNLEQSHEHNNGLMVRNTAIDTYRGIGLLLIILAHVNPPFLLMNFRCFDVPLMVFASGLVYSKKKLNYSVDYLKNRFLRLVLPCYLFLAVYYSLVVIALLFGIDFGIRWHHVYGSFLFLEGFGYLWIIRVFLLISLASPIFQNINSKISNNFIFGIMLICVMIIPTFLINHNIGMNSIAIRDCIYYILGYGVVYLISLRSADKNLNFLFITSTVLFILFILYAIGISMNNGLENIHWYNITAIENYKYPPSFYFISYGLLMSMLFYILVVRCHMFNTSIILQFIGSNSIWIYLIHIPFIQISEMYNINWLIRYGLVLSCSIGFYGIQYTIINKIKFHYPKINILNYLIG